MGPDLQRWALQRNSGRGYNFSCTGKSQVNPQFVAYWPPRDTLYAAYWSHIASRTPLEQFFRSPPMNACYFWRSIYSMNPVLTHLSPSIQALDEAIAAQPRVSSISRSNSREPCSFRQVDFSLRPLMTISVEMLCLLWFLFADASTTGTLGFRES